ncbi:hypothetical protein K439DRAFT_1640587 [Ramaria rubella]|nr:hypothetical protein K439DRAFT_1640587 [Ramaria rubella]
MRLVRSFSTSIWLRKQALYEPYVSPLNEEQKKALRKIMARSVPRYHGRLSRDIENFLKAYHPTPSLMLDRKVTIERVEEIVKSAFGSGYSIIDRSLYTYARDIETAPIELAICDNSHPEGFQPGTEGQPLPDPYSHEVLAALLEKHGYTGHFVVGDAEHMKSSDSNPPAIETRGPLPLYPPWPSFTPHSVSYLTYPPVLYAEHSSNATLPFFLSTPMPTYQPLKQLLQAYSSINPSFPDAISIITLWVRSINMPQITPACIALMFIGFLQNQKNIPSLQNPTSPDAFRKLSETDQGVWVRAEYPPHHPPTAFWLETAFMQPSRESNQVRVRKFGPLLFEFFRFWSQEHSAGKILSSQIVSVREGTLVNRTPVSKNTLATLDRDNSLQHAIQRGAKPWTPAEEPLIWRTQPIVVQDPFIPSYNHAQSLSKVAASYFHYFNSLSQRTLFRGHPFATVIGPHLLPPRASANSQLHQSTRRYSTRTLGSGNVIDAHSRTPTDGTDSLLGDASMCSFEALARDARQMYESMLPPPPVLAARQKTILRVQNAIRNRFGPEYSIELFGSTRYGVSSATSDLDLVIMDPKLKDGFTPTALRNRLPEVYNTRAVARTLTKSGFTQVLAVPWATVPIVKFRDPDTGLECDLNSNDLLGLWNTRLVERYCDLAPDLVRPMILIIKHWAKSHGLNDPSGQHGPVSFSSYALALMVIGFLQMKGVLPNLQENLQPLPKEAKRGFFWVRTRKKDSVRCDTRFSIGQDWSPKSQMDLGEALTGWFSFMGRELDYSEDLLNIRAGGLIKRRKNPPKAKGKKKGKEKSSLEVLEDTLQAEEDAALAAWREQTKSENGSEATASELEDAEEDEEVYEMASESQTDVYELQGEAVYERPPGHAKGLEKEEQPTRWGENILIVADPFILAKNVCARIGEENIKLFRAECRKAVLLLSWGKELSFLMGDRGAEKERDGRGSRGRGRGRGKANQGERREKRNDDTLPKQSVKGKQHVTESPS